MVLRMACPTRRKGSDNWYFRRKIPADVQRILASLPKDQRPAGWYKTHISISLGTADRNEAKAKCPEVAAAVERQIEAFRNPLNLMRSNLGIMSRSSKRVWWLVLQSGEVDKVYDLRGLPNYVPDAITRHRALVPEPRPTSCPWPLPARIWHRIDPPKVATVDGPPPPAYAGRPSKGPRIIGPIPRQWA